MQSSNNNDGQPAMQPNYVGKTKNIARQVTQTSSQNNKLKLVGLSNDYGNRTARKLRDWRSNNRTHRHIEDRQPQQLIDENEISVTRNTVFVRRCVRQKFGTTDSSCREQTMIMPKIRGRLNAQQTIRHGRSTNKNFRTTKTSCRDRAAVMDENQHQSHKKTSFDCSLTDRAKTEVKHKTQARTANYNKYDLALSSATKTKDMKMEKHDRASTHKLRSKTTKGQRRA